MHSCCPNARCKYCLNFVVLCDTLPSQLPFWVSLASFTVCMVLIKACIGLEVYWNSDSAWLFEGKRVNNSHISQKSDICKLKPKTVTAFAIACYSRWLFAYWEYKLKVVSLYLVWQNQYSHRAELHLQFVQTENLLRHSEASIFLKF